MKYDNLKNKFPEMTEKRFDCSVEEKNKIKNG